MIKFLVNDNNELCQTDDDKLWTLVDCNFFTKDQKHLVGVADVVEEGDAGRHSIEELEEKLREALQGTSNRSVLGPNGISS